MNFQRTADGRSRLEKVSNDDIKNIMDVKHDIVDDIRTAQNCSVVQKNI